MKKKAAGIILAGMILFSGTFTFAQSADNTDNTLKIQFSDITNHWAKDAVQNLLKRNAVPFGDDMFLPSKAITKGEFALMLHKAMGIQIDYFRAPDIKDYFDDIKGDAPYAAAVIDLVTANILEGGGSFKPDATVTREEMVHIIMQAYKYKLGETYALIKIGAATFKDTSDININYSGEVAIAQHYKLIAGTGDNMFHPQKATTRAEAAAVINKLAIIVDKQNSRVTISPEAVETKGSLEMKISIKNSSDKAVIINHTSGQKFDFTLLDKDSDILYTWSADKSFIMALTSTTIKPGETLEFKDTLSGEAYAAVKDKAMYLKAYITGESQNFNINHNGYIAEIIK